MPQGESEITESITSEELQSPEIIAVSDRAIARVTFTISPEDQNEIFKKYPTQLPVKYADEVVLQVPTRGGPALEVPLDIGAISNLPLARRITTPDADILEINTTSGDPLYLILGMDKPNMGWKAQQIVNSATPEQITTLEDNDSVPVTKTVVVSAEITSKNAIICLPGGNPDTISTATKDSNATIVYAAAFLDRASQDKLLEQFSSTHPNKYAHHMTTVFRPATAAGLGLGDEVLLKVIGQLKTPEIDALLVDGGDGLRHITLATAEGITPDRSKLAIKTALQQVPNPIDYFDKPLEVPATNGFFTQVKMTSLQQHPIYN